MKSTESRTLEGRRPSDDAHHTALCNRWCRLAAKTVKNRGALKLDKPMIAARIWLDDKATLMRRPDCRKK